MLPACMPGRSSRLPLDKHLGVLIGDSRPESVAAVKAALQAKFEDKASILNRMRILNDPSVKLSLLKSCVSTRPCFWLRTMSPHLTRDAAAWFDVRMREFMDHVATGVLDEHAWLLTTLPSSLSGLGVTSCMHSRCPAHTASWLSAFANIARMFPSAISLTAADLSSSSLPFARGLRAAHTATSLAATTLSDNTHNHPLPSCAPSDPSVPELCEFGTRFPRAQQRLASIFQGARWLEGFEGASVRARACMLSQADQGAMAGFAGAMTGQARMIPSSFITALQLRLRMPLSILNGINACSCGQPMDAHGDHLYSCSSLMTYRTPWHDLVLDVFCEMARRASFHVSHDSRRPRAASASYSPHWCPDATLIHGHATRGSNTA